MPGTVGIQFLRERRSKSKKAEFAAWDSVIGRSEEGFFVTETNRVLCLTLPKPGPPQCKLSKTNMDTLEVSPRTQEGQLQGAPEASYTRHTWVPPGTRKEDTQQMSSWPCLVERLVKLGGQSYRPIFPPI